MGITSEVQAWLEWVLTTSIPLLQLGTGDDVLDTGSGAMVDYKGHRFIVSVEHSVKRDSSGWAIAIQQGESGLEFYRPNSFVYVGEFRRSTSTLRHLDLCLAEVDPNLDSWYEYRTPRGLFDRRPHHVFGQNSMTQPDADAVYAFSGRIRRERHGRDAIVTEMVVYPGLKFTHSDHEVLHFSLPVPHPGHNFFKGCSGSPIVDRNQRVVALVIGGDIEKNMVLGIALDRCLPGFELLIGGSSET
ncbi:MAG: hypothetical protein AB1512_19510 [Thermodesulfobacteriota bacterium]